MPFLNIYKSDLRLWTVVAYEGSGEACRDALKEAVEAIRNIAIVEDGNGSWEIE
jgi:hypothetical protein